MSKGRYYNMQMAEIKKAISEAVADDELEILEKTDTTILVYDKIDGRDICYTGDESINEEWLAERIILPENVAKELNISKEYISSILIENLDKDYFNTLRAITIFEQESDFKTLADLLDVEEDDLSFNKQRFMNDCVGISIWADHVVIVNYSHLKKLSQEDPFNFDEDDIKVEIERGFWITLLHELRHNLLDGNPYLSEEKYPSCESNEDAVEQWAIRKYEKIF